MAPRGELNSILYGGKSYYPEHYLMKKIRLIRMKEENWRCQVCHGPAKQVHHIDGSRNNHHPENLMVICIKCHRKLFHSGPRRTHKTEVSQTAGLNESLKQLVYKERRTQDCKRCGFVWHGLYSNRKDFVN